MIKKLIFVYFAFWLIVLALGLSSDRAFLLSSQLGFFSAILIAITSFYSYKKKVLKKLKDRKEAKIEVEKDDEISDETDAKTVLEQERKKLKKQGLNLKNMDLTTAFVPYRLFAYGLLVAGFILLKRNELLSVFGLLLGLSVMPLGALIAGFLSKDDIKK